MVVFKMKYTSNDLLVLEVIKREKYIPSIKDLLNKVSNLEYGGIYYIVNKLAKNKDIIIEKYYDPTSGVDKKGVFIDEKAKNDFMQMNEVAHQVQTQVEIPDFFLKIYKLFSTITYSDDKKLKKIAKENGTTLRNVGSTIVDVLTEFLGEDLSKLGEMQKRAEKYMELIKDE